MTRLSRSILLIFSVLVLAAPVVFAEDITITTYYPSPYGSYNALFTDKLGVGDNNNDTFFTSADVPTTTGDVWIKGRLGIGTMVPGEKLAVSGTINAYAYMVLGGLGISRTLTVRDAGGSADCQINVIGGIIIFSDC